MSKIQFLFIIPFITLFGDLNASSRIAFSRPGNMIKIPDVSYKAKDNLLTVNASFENFSTATGKAYSINTITKSGYLYGISYVQPVDSLESTEFGLHFQRNILEYGDFRVDAGIQDLILRQGTDTDDGLDTRGLSFFSIMSTTKSFDDYFISTHLGFGTGKVNEDPNEYNESPNQNIGVFLGFNFKTPFLKNNGGLNFMTEYDGQGLNLGLSIPILTSTKINLSITNFENFGDFSTENISENNNLNGKPSISFGMEISIPKLFDPDEVIDEEIKPLGDGIYSKTDSSILFYDPICTDIVETLRDSIKVSEYIIENLTDHNSMLRHNEAILIDSTRKNLMIEQSNLINQNQAMRHLSRSLRFFYDEEYRNALSEVNSAIELNPNLAIAYGRRGSIYYKLGDNRRATLNWNVALQLDPEFTEIYDMLQASDQNRLTPVKLEKIGVK